MIEVELEAIEACDVLVVTKLEVRGMDGGGRGGMWRFEAWIALVGALASAGGPESRVRIALSRNGSGCMTSRIVPIIPRIHAKI